MIKKCIKIKPLNSKSDLNDDLEYWLKCSPVERIAAVESLRKQYHGSTERLQRSVRIIQQKQR